jgi:hypothetical protein
VNGSRHLRQHTSACVPVSMRQHSRTRGSVALCTEEHAP